MGTFDKATKIWSNPPIVPLYNPRTNIGQMVLSSLSIAGDRVVHIDAELDLRLTAKEIRVRTIRMAQTLKGLGYKEQDVFAIAAKTLPHVLPSLFSSLLIGAAVNTLDPGFNIADFSNMLKQTKPKVVFCESSNYEVINKSLKELGLTAKLYILDKVVEGESFVEELFKDNGDDMNFESPRIQDPDNYLALITCSSGTSGASKGIAITHKSFIEVSGVFQKFTDNEVLLLTGSLYWASNCFFLLHSTLLGIQRVINSDPYDPEMTLKHVQKYRISMILLSPTRLSLITQLPNIKDYDTSSIEFIGSYGSIFGETLKHKVNELFPDAVCFTAYGISEVIAACTRIVANFAPPNAVGYTEPGCEMKIINDDGVAVDNNTQGELCLRRTVMFNGYYGDPEKTKEAIDSEGWIHTGDVGFFDDQGVLHIVDRIKDIILYKNFWVVPGSLEDKIESLEGVQAAVVVGIPHEVDVELPAAVVIKTPGSKVTAEDVHKIVKDNFADTKQLRGGVYFVPSLPQTASGKFKRREVKQIAIKHFNFASKKSVFEQKG